MKNIIDVTMTATRRLSIFKKTIDSFWNNMFKEFIDIGNKINFYMNIDPVGDDGNINDFAEHIKDKFNFNKIHLSNTPNFPKAFSWAWSQSSSDFLFHLEDDWELLQKTDLLELINILDTEDDLAILRLAAFVAGKPRTDGVSLMKNWNKFFPYNGKYYECPEELKTSVGFCGHPSLIKGNFIKNVVDHLDDIHNPEKVFHSRGRTAIMQEVIKWRYGVYSVPGSPPLIADIGRRWMVENNFRKSGSKAYFTEWEKVT